MTTYYYKSRFFQQQIKIIRGIKHTSNNLNMQNIATEIYLHGQWIHICGFGVSTRISTIVSTGTFQRAYGWIVYEELRCYSRLMPEQKFV